MSPILIDTDPGQDIDDLLAIHFALLRPELDIKAITTVTWPSDQRARLIMRLLRYLDRQDIPVAAGMQWPLRPLAEAEQGSLRNLDWSMNHRCFAEPLDDADSGFGNDAVDLIIRTVEAHAGEIILCCIAPLTNIATALCRKPEIAGKIKAIMMMGGETALNRAEHNVAYDYNAAEIVFASGVPIVMGTWDVTRRFVISKDECRVFADHHSALHKALYEAILKFLPAHHWKPGPVMYDIFPFICAMGLNHYTLSQQSVQIETQGQQTRGMTLPKGNATHIHMSSNMDVDAVKTLYFQTVFG
jgi:purine nucleosidase/pyrimidine-specific ribonucleoside hydrolase